jgi:hypothetical protein
VRTAAFQVPAVVLAIVSIILAIVGAVILKNVFNGNGKAKNPA